MYTKSRLPACTMSRSRLVALAPSSRSASQAARLVSGALKPDKPYIWLFMVNANRITINHADICRIDWLCQNWARENNQQDEEEFSHQHSRGSHLFSN
jgi:hypothetical protein